MGIVKDIITNKTTILGTTFGFLIFIIIILCVIITFPDEEIKIIDSEPKFYTIETKDGVVVGCPPEWTCMQVHNFNKLKDGVWDVEVK